MRRPLSVFAVVSIGMMPFASFAVSMSETPDMNLSHTSTASTMLDNLEPTALDEMPKETSLSAAPLAAPVPTQPTASSTSLGEYTSVSCDTAIFRDNSCNQCFQWSAVKKGDRLTGLFDNWTNSTPNVLVAYKDEQKVPNMIGVGGASWVAVPEDEKKLWKDSSDIVWTPSGSRQSFMLTAGQKVRFMESDLGAGYTLESASQGHGDVVGLLRFPVVYHTIDMTSGSEGPAMTHYECVTYTLDEPNTPPAPPEEPNTPPEVTRTKTGPAETLLLIVAAFFIAFGLMFSLRKRV